MCMNFKDYLNIPYKDWAGIGRHLGIIVSGYLTCIGISSEQAAATLDLPYECVIEYLKGTASFGTFFPLAREKLKIGARYIFGRELGNEEKEVMASLDDYLTTIHAESFVPFLTVPPEEQMKKWLVGKLAEARSIFVEYTNEQIAEIYRMDVKKLERILRGEIDNVGWSKLFNNCMFLGLAFDQLVPVREMTTGEMHEIEQRWYDYTNGPGPNLRRKHEWDVKHGLDEDGNLTVEGKLTPEAVLTTNARISLSVYTYDFMPAYVSGDFHWPKHVLRRPDPTRAGTS